MGQGIRLTINLSYQAFTVFEKTIADVVLDMIGGNGYGSLPGRELYIRYDISIY